MEAVRGLLPSTWSQQEVDNFCRDLQGKMDIYPFPRQAGMGRRPLLLLTMMITVMDLVTCPVLSFPPLQQRAGGVAGGDGAAAGSCARPAAAIDQQLVVAIEREEGRQA